MERRPVLPVGASRPASVRPRRGENPRPAGPGGAVAPKGDPAPRDRELSWAHDPAASQCTSLSLADAVLTTYFVVLLLLSIYGSHRYVLVYRLRRYGARAGAAAERMRMRGAPLLEREPPAVLIQLPVFNERYVVERLIRAVAALD